MKQLRRSERLTKLRESRSAGRILLRQATARICYKKRATNLAVSISWSTTPGIAPDQRVDLLNATVESFDRLIGVNLKGPYFLTQAVANWMIEQRSAGIAGFSPAIINISSVSAYAASPGRGDYCVSKAGLSMMTKLYAARLASEGINVYEIRPGVISTDMTADVKDKYDQLIDADLTPIKRWGTPEDVGRAAAAIATGAFPFSTGEVINVDGGFHLRRL